MLSSLSETQRTMERKSGMMSDSCSLTHGLVVEQYILVKSSLGGELCTETHSVQYQGCNRHSIPTLLSCQSVH